MLASAILEHGITRLAERFGLDALWLFGSEARGSATIHPDILTYPSEVQPRRRSGAYDRR